MKSELEFLFGSRARWRLIKFFMLNGDKGFTAQEISKKNKLAGKEVYSILGQFVKGRFLLARSKNKRKFYLINPRFPFYSELKNLVIKSNIYPQCESLSKIKNLGDVKLALVSGVFINYPKAKTDLLIVADNVSRTKLQHLLENMEAELGREFNYSLLTLAEFKYRANMFDKFIMEILEAPHESIINKVSNIVRELKLAKRQ
jgi:hypothetical protein